MKKTWKLYLYYNGILIKKIRIREDEEPSNNSYAIRVYFKKQLFKTIVASIVVRPVRLLKNDDNRRITYWGTTMETGIEV